MRRIKQFVVGTVIVTTAWLGLNSAASAADLSISAAASLKEAVSELADNFAKDHPEVQLVKNFGGSGGLAKQIENGAPADLFIAANEEWVTYLAGKNLIGAGLQAPFAYNSLVFSGKPAAGVKGLTDLTKLGRIAIGSPKSVPAGEYAQEALTKAGLWPELEKKLVMARDVRECLMYAERGEVAGALVYRTDALLLGKQTMILFEVPPEFHACITYPMALTVSGGKKPEAIAFFSHLQSAAAKAVLTRYGFVVP